MLHYTRNSQSITCEEDSKNSDGGDDDEYNNEPKV